MSSIARKVDLGRPIPKLAFRRGVITLDEMRQLDHGRTIIENAQQEAREITDAARAHAAAELEQQRRETEQQRQSIVQDAEATIWREASEHIAALDAQFERFVQQLEEQALPVVRKAITTLANEAPAEQRIRACVQALLSEAGRPAQSILRVHQDDLPVLEAMDPPLPWTIKADSEIEPGGCRLVAQHGGEWSSSFAGRLDRLMTVFDRSCSAAAEADTATQETDDD